MVSSRKAEHRQQRKLLKTAKGYFVPRCLRKATKNRCVAGVSRVMTVCSCKGGPKIAWETSRNWRWQRHPCLGKQIAENGTNGKKRVEMEPWKMKSVADLKSSIRHGDAEFGIGEDGFLLLCCCCCVYFCCCCCSVFSSLYSYSPYLVL